MKKRFYIILILMLTFICTNNFIFAQDDSEPKKKQKSSYNKSSKKKSSKKKSSKKKFAEVKPVENKSVENKSIENKPVEKKPVEIRSVEKKSAEKKPSVNKSDGYNPPERVIDISPYGGYIYAKNLFTDRIKDKPAYAAGLDVKFQIYGNFGMLLDGMWSNLKAEKTQETNKDYNMMVISGGFYYNIYGLKIDMCYGAITAGPNVMTILIPGIEYSYQFFPRFLCFVKVEGLFTNDWIIKENYKEKYTSAMVSAGFSVRF